MGRPLWDRAQALAAAHGLRSPAAAAVITSGPQRDRERAGLAAFIARQAPGAGALLGGAPYVIVAGASLEEAALGVPEEALEVVVISPHLPDREGAFAAVRRRWPRVAPAFAAPIPENHYVVVDLRPGGALARLQLRLAVASGAA